MKYTLGPWNLSTSIQFEPAGAGNVRPGESGGAGRGTRPAVFKGAKQHVPRSVVNEQREIERVEADCLISFAGGSPIDACKVASHAFLAKREIIQIAIPTPNVEVILCEFGVRLLLYQRPQSNSCFVLTWARLLRTPILGALPLEYCCAPHAPPIFIRRWVAQWSRVSFLPMWTWPGLRC